MRPGEHREGRSDPASMQRPSNAVRGLSTGCLVPLRSATAVRMLRYTPQGTLSTRMPKEKLPSRLGVTTMWYGQTSRLAGAQ